MVVITCNIRADNGPTQYLEHVNLSWWDLQKEDLFTDVVLVSGQYQVRVHREILLRVSSFLHDLVPPSCSCETPAITLPKVQPDTLKALVELAYTGRSRVGSRKVTEEFRGLSELLQIGFEVQCEEIVCQEREDYDHVTQVELKDVIAADTVKKTDAVERKNDEEISIPPARKKTEEKAAAERKKPEDIADAAGKKYEEDNTSPERGENELGAAEYKRKKNEKNIAEGKKRIDYGKYVGRAKEDAESKKSDAKGTALKDIAADQEIKAYAEFKKSDEKVTNIKYIATEKENDESKTAIAKKMEKKLSKEMLEEAINVLKRTDLKLAPPSAEKRTLVEEASPVKVGRSLRRIRTRGRKSTVQEPRAIPFLSPVSPRRRTKSPDSIFAKTTRNQKRKIQNILNASDDINATPEPKRKKVRLAIQPTEKSSKFVNISVTHPTPKTVNIKDITADSIAETDLFGENGENENNNDLFIQDPIKVNAANDSYKRAYFHNSIENPFENTDVSVFSDEGKAYSAYAEKMIVCPFCQKKFYTKSRYDQHLSWNHFQLEITAKFPGLECAVCAKRFVKKSNYVHHLGSFHKVIDGLMTRSFDDKMAQIKEEEQSKPFTIPKRHRKKDSGMETPKRMNIGTPIQNIDTPKQIIRTPKYSVGIPKQNIGAPKQDSDKSTPKQKSPKSGGEPEENRDTSDNAIDNKKND